MMIKKKFKIFHRKRFCLSRTTSPTYFNLHRYLQEQDWTPTRFNWLANFSEKNFEFDVIAAEYLEYKHLLARMVNQYCPEVMPETYYINDSNWSTVLSEIADKYYLQNNRLVDQLDHINWILKPALLNNGQHIKIFQQLSQIEQHYFSANRMGGDHVLQQYLTRAHLLNGNKYSIRMFVIVTNYAGAYLYPHGYFNVALHPYQPNNFSDLRGHLTNEHLTDDASNVRQVPTQQLDYLFSTLYQPIKKIITTSLNSLQQLHPHAFICKKHRAFSIFGFDFMVDTDCRVWLLEANHGPCFPTRDEHPLHQPFYHNFWQALISSFILPIAKQQSLKLITYTGFEPLFNEKQFRRRLS